MNPLHSGPAFAAVHCARHGFQCQPDPWRGGKHRLQGPLRLHLLHPLFVLNQFGDLESSVVRPGKDRPIRVWEAILVLVCSGGGPHMWKQALVALLLAGTSLPATAQSVNVTVLVNGNELYDWCTSSSGNAKTSFCLGFIMGVLDTITTMQATKQADRQVCVPRGVTPGQARDVLLAYLNQKPQERHVAAASLVWVSLHEAWPCR